jgi:hypothetical protein
VIDGGTYLEKTDAQTRYTFPALFS